MASKKSGAALSKSANNVMRISAVALARAQYEGSKIPEIAARKFGPPSLPPGVVPKRREAGYVALDSAGNAALYDWVNQNVMYCGIAFPGYAYLAQLTQRSEYRAPTETLATEMTRMGFELESNSDDDKGDKLKELTQACKDFNVSSLLHTVATYDGFFGRGQIYINIKGQDGDEARKRPLMISKEGIRKGSLIGFKAIEPVWTTPFTYNSIDPTAPDFYKPTAWYILGKQTHATRLLNFTSREVPDFLKPAYNFGGLAMSQLMEPYVIRWLKTVDGVNKIINNFSILTLATNLAATLSADEGAELIRRAQLFTQTRDNQGLMLTDKESEELVQIAVPLSGLSELQAQAQEHMAAPAHMPLVKLTGITPSGLNASSEGEIDVWYDYVKGMQELLYRPNLKTIIDVLQLHLYGEIDPDITFSFVQLDQVTETEGADIRAKDTERDVKYIAAGVIAPEEARARLQSDQTSGYSELTGDAPEPPELTGMEKQHELGEESADNAHQRSEESADKARKHEKSLTDKSKPG